MGTTLRTMQARRGLLLLALLLAVALFLVGTVHGDDHRDQNVAGDDDDNEPTHEQIAADLNAKGIAKEDHWQHTPGATKTVHTPMADGEHVEGGPSLGSPDPASTPIGDDETVQTVEMGGGGDL